MSLDHMSSGSIKERDGDLCRRPVGVHREERGDLAADPLRKKRHRLRVERRHEMPLLDMF